MFKIGNPFKKEKKDNIEVPASLLPEIQGEAKDEAVGKIPEITVQNEKKVEIEVLIAKIDALKFQYEALNEKINNIEKMVKEIYEMAKSSSS